MSNGKYTWEKVNIFMHNEILTKFWLASHLNDTGRFDMTNEEVVKITIPKIPKESKKIFINCRLIDEKLLRLLLKIASIDTQIRLLNFNFVTKQDAFILLNLLIEFYGNIERTLRGCMNIWLYGEDILNAGCYSRFLNFEAAELLISKLNEAVWNQISWRFWSYSLSVDDVRAIAALHITQQLSFYEWKLTIDSETERLLISSFDCKDRWFINCEFLNSKNELKVVNGNPEHTLNLKIIVYSIWGFNFQNPLTMFVLFVRDPKLQSVFNHSLKASSVSKLIWMNPPLTAMGAKMLQSSFRSTFLSRNPTLIQRSLDSRIQKYSILE